MPGRPKSQTKKSQIHSEKQEEALTDAIKVYLENQQKPEDSEERKSLRKICKEVEEEWQEKKGYRNVRVARDTVQRRLQGGRSCHQFNMETNSWLTTDEEKLLVIFCLDYAARGFPLNHRTLKLHVDNILRARLGNDFPESGVGKNWTDRFVERQSNSLGRYWTAPLDTARGRAVNKTTNERWYNLLGDTIKKNNIEEDCIWAADETGFQPGGGVKERVIGPAHIKTQHQQRDGDRENITVMVTICADGDEIPPTVIYKGKTFSTAWHQANTLKAS